MRTVLASLFILGIGVTSCGLEETTTLGAYCVAAGSAYCVRAAQCGQPVPASCTADFSNACCSGSACGKEVSSEMQTACVDALRVQSCAEMSVGALPAACTS